MMTQTVWQEPAPVVHQIPVMKIQIVQAKRVQVVQDQQRLVMMYRK
jgi:hypothetical protein